MRVVSKGFSRKGTILVKRHTKEFVPAGDKVESPLTNNKMTNLNQTIIPLNPETLPAGR